MELKPYIGPHPTNNTLTEYYLKSEADKVIAEKNTKIRRLRRALYKACAMWADRTRLICSVFGSDAPKIRWERMYDKCRAKAEEYK